MSDQQRMTDERRKEIQAECWFITGRPYPDNVPSRKELMLVECEAELHRLEQAHAELHRYNDSIGLNDCEFCEALERVGEGALTRAKGEQDERA